MRACLFRVTYIDDNTEIFFGSDVDLSSPEHTEFTAINPPEDTLQFNTWRIYKIPAVVLLVFFCLFVCVFPTSIGLRV